MTLAAVECAWIPLPVWRTRSRYEALTIVTVDTAWLSRKLAIEIGRSRVLRYTMAVLLSKQCGSLRDWRVHRHRRQFYRLLRTDRHRHDCWGRPREQLPFV